ncbi:uroporphyrinogen-III C-methyltransferase [Suicoccus acidiformans]|uniref:Uroporphyrinogen-III C-methyltransferase n=2 Tax=Suicoccus acidiformans TaxID=2036206 RepID=A0A347WM12_9LACT|nr:uroporphyrinogen-III C-methyltransferase [Suicoccus acidiformans]
MKNKGTVYIVGSGLGRISDLTLRAYQLLKTADIVFYDRLVNDNLLQLTKEHCELVYVGKKPYASSHTQEDIESQLLAAAQKHQVILRLKSGDPFVFGRGGEEGMTLKDAGVTFEIIPGISSVINGPTYGGIPVTYREYSRSFHVYTAQSKDGETDFDWHSIVQFGGTHIFLMGLRALSNIVRQLQIAGMPETTPIALVQWASRPNQRTVIGELRTIEEKVRKAQLTSPVVIVVGDVVDFSESLNTFERLPWFGQRVGFPTEARIEQMIAFESMGAELVLYPRGTKRIQKESENISWVFIPSIESMHSAERFFSREIGLKFGTVSDQVRESIDITQSKFWIGEVHHEDRNYISQFWNEL